MDDGAVHPTDGIAVRFAGDGSGVEEMSWGQWEIWLAMKSQSSSLPIGGTAPLRVGTTLADAADELRYLMSRFQSMRTRLTFDAAGRPRQVLSGEGEITLEVFEAGEADPVGVAAVVQAGYEAKAFDYAGEWPVRMAVICRYGTPVYLVSIMCHLVTDGPGGMVMLDEVHRRPDRPVDGMQPMEQARWQRSPAGVRHNEKVLRHWEGLLHTIPLGQLAGLADPRQPRYWQGRLRSRALLLALRGIGVRTGADSATVLLALFAVALLGITGVNPVVTRPVVSNRFRPGLANVVCMLAQAGLCVMDVAGLSLDEAVGRVQRSAMTAYKHAYFDPERLAALMDEVAAKRGPGFSLSCFFNDRRDSSRADAIGAAAGAEELAAAARESAFDWTTTQETPFDELFVHVEEVTGLIELTVDFDTGHLAAGHAETLLRDMERIAVAAG